MLQQDTTELTFVDRLQSSFREVFGDLIPALLGALIIVFAGYLLAKVLARIVDRFLRRLGLNRLLERGGVMEAVERSGTQINPARVISNLVFWLVMFAVILVAANALGLESLASQFGQLVRYIPSVIAAIVIILVGIVLGQFVGGLIRTSGGAVPGGAALARVGDGGVVCPWAPAPPPTGESGAICRVSRAGGGGGAGNGRTCHKQTQEQLRGGHARTFPLRAISPFGPRPGPRAQFHSGSRPKRIAR